MERRVSLRVLQRAQSREIGVTLSVAGRVGETSEVYLKAGVAAEVEQRLHDLQVTLVDRDV